MPTRVNKKFVILLSAALALVCVGVIYLALKFFLRSASELASLGDRQMAAQDYRGAQRMYAKAVNKEISNADYLARWIDSFDHIVPETPAEFDQFYQLYVGAHRQLAINKTDDIPTQRKYLDLLMSRIEASGYQRGSLENLASEVDNLMSRYLGPGATEPSNPKANQLRRYRGIAQLRIMEIDPNLKKEVVDAVREDLRAAIAADPDDVESSIALEGWYAIQARRLSNAQRFDEAKTMTDAGAQVINELAAAHPGSPWVTMYRVRRELESTQSALKGNDDAQLRDATTAFRARVKPLIDRLGEEVKALPPEQITYSMLTRERNIEELADPASHGARTEAGVRLAQEARPDDPDLILLRADILASRQEYAAAIDVLRGLVEMPKKTVSTVGIRLFALRDGARFLQALWGARNWELASLPAKPGEKPDEKALSDAAARAKSLRDAFAAEEQPDSPRLMLVDAIHAYMNRDYATSNRLLDNYNVKTQNADPDALWLGAQVALRVQQTGRAKERLESYLTLRPNDLRAVLTLADLNANLQQWDAAADWYRKFLGIMDNAEVKERLERVIAASGKGESADPIARTLREADDMAKRLAGQPGDLQQVQQFLADAARRNDMDPRLVAALVIAYMRESSDANREAALRAIEAGLGKHPDDRTLKALRVSVEVKDPVERANIMLDAQDMPEVDRLLAKYNVARDAGRKDLVESIRAQAAQAAPDDPRVVELTFMDAIEDKRWPDAQKLADQAAAKDIDRAQGKTFKARLVAAQGDPAGAIDLMQEVVKAGGASPEAWRLLGRIQQVAGRRGDAVRSYQEALKLRTNDTATILDLLRGLVVLGRNDEALRVARDAEKYARGSGEYTNLWLALEAQVGDKQKALQRRTEIARAAPDNRENLAALCSILLDLKMYPQARERIDQLRALKDGLDAVAMDAAWRYAQNDKENGRKVFDDYIASMDQSKLTTTPYMALAQFLVSQKDLEGAIQALEQARPRQDSKQLEVDRTLSDLLMQVGDAARCLDATNRVIAAGADTDDKMYTKRAAESLIRLDRAAEAEKVLAPLSAKDPDATTLLILADAKAAQHDDAGARALLDRAVRNFPDDPNVFTRRGQSMLADSRYSEDAAADFTRALQLAPDDWRVLRLRALAYVQKGRLDDAVRDLRQAAHVAPFNDDLVLGLVSDLVRMGRSNEAVESANDAITQRPDDAALLSNCGLIFYNARQWSQAQSFLKRAFAIDKSGAIPQRYLDTLLNATPPDLVNAELALKDCGPSVNTNPGLLMAYGKLRRAQGRGEDMAKFVVQAFLLLDQNNPNQMLAWYNDMRRLIPEPAGLQAFLERSQQLKMNQEWMAYFRGDLMIQQLDNAALFQQGATLLTGLLNSENRYISMLSYRRLGSAYYIKQTYDQAEHVWREGVSKFGNDVEMLNNLAYLLAKHFGKGDEAVPFAEQAAKVNSGSYEVLDTLGVVYTLAGKPDQGVTALERAIVLTETPQAVVQTNMHLASAYHAAKREEEAKRAVRTAMDAAEKAGDAIQPDTRKELQDLRVTILGQ